MENNAELCQKELNGLRLGQIIEIFGLTEERRKGPFFCQ